jgi:hypothetical protein
MCVFVGKFWVKVGKLWEIVGNCGKCGLMLVKSERPARLGRRARAGMGGKWREWAGMVGDSQAEVFKR